MELMADRDAVDVIAAAAEHHPDVIVIPTERLDDAFFRLRTGIAGQIIQELLTYRLRLVIMGNISKHLQENSALRDFVYECNSGSNVKFVSALTNSSSIATADRSNPVIGTRPNT
jgi:Domain of unknown function (DUF4180)